MDETEKKIGSNKDQQPKTDRQKKFSGARNYGKNNPDKRLEFSVVIPLLNEEESLEELSQRLATELDDIAGGKYEVIFIDDGSTDKSFEVIKRISGRNNKFKCIRFRRNYGKSAALAVGFSEARGRYVATMDADLQDDPAELRTMLAKLNEGYDLVSGWKKKRYDPISKTLPSKLFNSVTSMASGIKLHDFNCGLKLYRKEVVKTVHVYGEMHRYIPALAHWEGFRVTELPVQHHARKYGKSKFGLSRFINGFLDLLTVLFTTRYLKRPLHFFGLFGAIFTAVGLGINIVLVKEWFQNETYLSNRPLFLFAIALIIVGIQFISVGLLGEMLAKLNMKNLKNNYSIKEKVNL